MSEQCDTMEFWKAVSRSLANAEVPLTPTRLKELAEKHGVTPGSPTYQRALEHMQTYWNRPDWSNSELYIPESKEPELHLA